MHEARADSVPRKIRRCGVRHNQSVVIGDIKVTLKVRKRKPRDHYTLIVDSAPELSPIVLDRVFSEMDHYTSQ